VHVLTRVHLGQPHALVAAIGIAGQLFLLQRHVIDIDAIGDDLDAITRQTHHALDVVDGRIRRIAEHDHITALGLMHTDDFRVEHRQPETVVKLVHQDEIPGLQRGHHGISGNAERLEQE
jgi:hypothetical protein